MTETSQPFRSHFFSLAVSKHIFQHSTHGLVFVRDAMRCSEAQKYGLSPLLLYALSIQDTSIRRMTFAPLNQPHPIYAVLHRLWTKEAESFRGRPDALVLSRQAAAAATQRLTAHLAFEEVELIVANKGDKVSGAMLRSAQEEAMSLGLISNNTERIDNLDALNEAAADRHKFVMEIRGSIVKKHREHQEQWDALQVRAVAPLSGADTMDWSPGPWLFSWEQNLPPNSQPRFFSMDSDGRKMWLFVGHEPEQDDSEEDELAPEQEWEEFEESEMLSLAKDMVACWPNSMAEVARTIGTTARDLKWALDGKTRLDQSALSKLLLMLSIEYGESGYYEAVGPCVLIARNIGAAARIYVELSRGGNLEASYEAVPESGEADPSWRYLVFHRDFGGASIIMFERGSQAGTRLNKKAFINFEGVRQVPNNLYRDVVATAARASRNPPANRLEMMGFMERHPDGGV